MAFWGVEVRPGKPCIHVLDESCGRLRLSQATLGNGKSAGKSVLQCNVGEKSPILLCSLITDKNETCHLELEFEETEDVVFSVLGQRSVHLAGYYLGSSGNNRGGEDESESYGEDIAETESDNSGGYDSDEDEYEADFIDDGDIKMFSSSPRRKSNVVIEEIVDDELPTDGNGNNRRNKRQNQVSDSDVNASQRQLVKRNGPMIEESEDEDGFPIFSTKTKTSVGGVDGSSNFDDSKWDDKKRKITAIISDAKPARVEKATDNNEKSKKKKKKSKDKQGLFKEGVCGYESQDVKTKETALHNDQEQTLEVNLENIDGDTVKAGALGTDSDRKMKKRKKEKLQKENTSETGSTVSGEKADGDQTGLDGSRGQNLPVETKKELAAVEGDGMTKKKNKKKKFKDDEAYDKSKHEKGEHVKEDQAKIGGDSKIINAVLTEQSNNDLEKSGKKKKKKKKNQESDSTVKHQCMTKEHEDATKPLQTRVFGNGFTVEELSMGKPDGKRASRGNKVSVKYIGKLKNGKIFDSNVGKKPFTFRLGIGEVIKGWDIGVEGMRIGDKRRLTVPPSLGYGSTGVGQILPNSWLIFDVELVDTK